jgi:hypothetical protein
MICSSPGCGIVVTTFPQPMSPRVSPSPPRPRQIVHVGVVGHRPNRIAAGRLAALPGECRSVLLEIERRCKQLRDPQLCSDEALLMRIISPLAEGADRLVAQAGLELGAELQCPLPFHSREYMVDFADDASKQEYLSLLARASSVFEMDGLRKDEGKAYEQAGEVVVAHSDVVLAIWDGEAGQGRGGTLQMIDEALRREIPVLWVHAAEERVPVILTRDSLGNRGTLALEDLAGRLSLLSGKEVDSTPGVFDVGRAFFREKQARVDGGRLFSIFRRFVVTGKISFGSMLSENFEQGARREWEEAMPSHPALQPETRTFLLDKLCPYYAWADGLSSYYAGLFRTSSVGTNLLSAFAVLFALLGILFVKEDGGHRWRSQVPSLVELFLIVAVLSITSLGRRCRWHERWLNYRQLAERLRQYFFLAPLGCSLPTPRESAQMRPEHGGSAVDVAFHAIARDLGLAPGVVDRGYLASMGELIDNVLESQIAYHEANHVDMEMLKHRLHKAGTALFVLTLLACCTHVIGGLGEHHVPPWVHLLAIAPPAFGAAFYGITNHGEFARSADRSLAMAQELVRRRKDVEDALKSGTDNFTSARAAAMRLAETMISETLDWNTLFRYRQLNLPG